MPLAACNQSHVTVRIQIRKALYERDQIPQVLVTHLPAPGLHARSLDAMLDDPESTGRLDRHLAQIGGCRIQAGAQFGGLPARRKVTTHADRKSTRLNSSHSCASRLPSSA